jgi:hypothetical protein
MGDMSPLRWVLVIVFVLGVVALLAWDRGEPGADERWPDRADYVFDFRSET